MSKGQRLLHNIKGLFQFEHGGHLTPYQTPRRIPSYNAGGDIQRMNNQQEAINKGLIDVQQNTGGQITDDSIRQQRVRKFIADINQQSPMFIDTILRR